MLYSFLTNLPRWIKRLIVFCVDLALIPLNLYFAYGLRFDTFQPFADDRTSVSLFFLLTAIGGFIIIGLRLPRVKLNAFEAHSVLRLGAAAALITVAAVLLSYFLYLGTPRSVPLIFGTSFLLSSVLARVAGLVFFRFLSTRSEAAVPVAVYGAGAAGIQLVSALRHSVEVVPVALVDDNPGLHGLVVSGIVVKSPSELKAMVQAGRVKRVLVAIPSATHELRARLVARLSDIGAEVRILPSYVDLLLDPDSNAGQRTVAPDELLGRDKVNLEVPEIAGVYAGRVVMVTGAGGSIGSELCRQLMTCNPRKIVLFEQSEFSLYEIEKELQTLAQEFGVGITARLGSVTNRARVRNVMTEQGVDVVFHAAAYKHVPLVEDNELEGADNNVIGTKTVADVAEECSVERFVLISTDKAVRPTNIMGATKRMAELVIQDIQSRNGHTKFSMVRFGNVLGSSGSVIPLFQQQIAAGGPVTVTHPDVVRYFMTIPEASRLVLLAGAYAKGGDVFVLDMGKPARIIDIAKRMIVLSGNTVKEGNSAEGKGIEIVITGLRPGEKLYEELLIDGNGLTSTAHNKIFRAEESRLSEIEVASMLKELNAALGAANPTELRRLVVKYVDGYHVSKSQAVDAHKSLAGQ